MKTNQTNNWEGFPLRSDIGESPTIKDIPPQRTEEGDFIVYHGTSLENANKIMQQKTLLPDDIGSVGFGTIPDAVNTYATHKGNPVVLQITISKEWLKQQDIRHEIGGHGHSSFLINPNFILKQKAKIPPEAIKDIKIISNTFSSKKQNWYKKAKSFKNIYK